MGVSPRAFVCLGMAACVLTGMFAAFLHHETYEIYNEDQHRHCFRNKACKLVNNDKKDVVEKGDKEYKEFPRAQF